MAKQQQRTEVVPFQGSAPLVDSSRNSPLSTNVSAEERLQFAAEAANLGTWDLVLPSNELHWCSRCKEIFGIAPDSSFYYEHFLERVHPEDRSRVDAVVKQSIDPRGPGTYDIEYRIVQPGGDIRWIAASGKAYFGDFGGEVRAFRFLGTLLDCTGQKRAQELLIQSEKLAVTGRLAAAIAHEIKNPLDAVGNLLYLLRTETSEQVRTQYLDMASAELARA